MKKDASVSALKKKKLAAALSFSESFLKEYFDFKHLNRCVSSVNLPVLTISVSLTCAKISR